MEPDREDNMNIMQQYIADCINCELSNTEDDNFNDPLSEDINGDSQESTTYIHKPHCLKTTSTKSSSSLKSSSSSKSSVRMKSSLEKCLDKLSEIHTNMQNDSCTTTINELFGKQIGLLLGQLTYRKQIYAREEIQAIMNKYLLESLSAEGEMP